LEIDGIAITIDKHIVAEQALSGCSKSICIEESTNLGVVVSGLEVIEPVLFIAAYISIGLFYSISAYPVKLF
jgi:hypothetical protein